MRKHKHFVNTWPRRENQMQAIPKLETLPSQPSVTPGGNVECGPKLSKHGKLCHCFEHIIMEKNVFFKVHNSAIFLHPFDDIIFGYGGG